MRHIYNIASGLARGQKNKNKSKLPKSKKKDRLLLASKPSQTPLLEQI
jgi:hypothetical protein